MTKTRARAAAARQLSYGHYRPGGGRAWVNCPVCKQQVSVEFDPWKGAQPFLRMALESHLVEDH